MYVYPLSSIPASEHVEEIEVLDHVLTSSLGYTTTYPERCQLHKDQVVLEKGDECAVSDPSSCDRIY